MLNAPVSGLAIAPGRRGLRIFGSQACEVHPAFYRHVAVLGGLFDEVCAAFVFLGCDEAGAGSGEAVNDYIVSGAAVDYGPFV